MLKALRHKRRVRRRGSARQPEMHRIPWARQGARRCDYGYRLAGDMEGNQRRRVRHAMHCNAQRAVRVQLSARMKMRSLHRSDHQHQGNTQRDDKGAPGNPLSGKQGTHRTVLTIAGAGAASNLEAMPQLCMGCTPATPCLFAFGARDLDTT